MHADACKLDILFFSKSKTFLFKKSPKFLINTYTSAVMCITYTITSIEGNPGAIPQ